MHSILQANLLGGIIWDSLTHDSGEWCLAGQYNAYSLLHPDDRV